MPPTVSMELCDPAGACACERERERVCVNACAFVRERAIVCVSVCVRACGSVCVCVTHLCGETWALAPRRRHDVKEASFQPR